MERIIYKHSIWGKSGEKLDYNFLDVKETTTFFSLAVSIPETN